MDDAFETVLVEFDEDTGVGYLTMDRPDSLNAMNEQLRTEFVAGLEALARRNRGADGVVLRAVVVDGAGDRAFSAGADITEFAERSPGRSPDRSLRATLEAFPAPVIAEIQGYCLGGGLETALACDVRFASDDSTFGLPEVDLGIIPGAGGTQYLAELAGPAVAMELVMTAERFGADRAEELGLLNGVFAPAALEEEVAAFAEELASKAPLAVQATKQSVQMAAQLGRRDAIEYDRQQASALLTTEDAAEGAAAFAEDREPSFEGR